MSSAYQSWSGLKRQLERLLCPALAPRVSYFLTRYHAVHNAYGRASVRVDGEEWASFTWADQYRQDADRYAQWKVRREDEAALLAKWRAEGTLSEHDFLYAAAAYRSKNPQAALTADDPLLRLFAVLDRRIGKRTLRALGDEGQLQAQPDWLLRFYLLRLSAEGIPASPTGQSNPAPPFSLERQSFSGK